jgi:DNA-binding response OmpR family regulator
MKKVLIIEDDQLVSTVYRNKLAAEGYEVTIADDGEKGLAAVKTFNPDLIILDLMLPKLNGVDLMKQLRAQREYEALPIVVFSNTYLSNIIKEAWKAGATKCFSKTNCSPKQILESVSALLNNPPGAAPIPTLKMAGADSAEGAKAGRPKFEGNAPVPVKVQDSPAQLFREQFPGVLASLRALHQQLAKSTSPDNHARLLREMCFKINGLTGGANLAGMISIARITDALEALTSELQFKPQGLNPSTLRTIASAVDFLDVLFKRDNISESVKNEPAKILVVDDELISRCAITHSLEKARLGSEDVDDPLVALKLVEENTYDLIFLDADMPSMNGFELCAKIRTLPGYKKTPVVFVTALNDFEARTNSTMAGANDFIAKPFLFVELAVKALVFVLRGKLEAAKA